MPRYQSAAQTTRKGLLSLLGLAALAGCRQAGGPAPETSEAIFVPTGFGVSVFHEGVGSARHLVVRPDGQVYVRLEAPKNGKTLVALRDRDGDGKADESAYFGRNEGGTGIALDARYLYYSTGTEVFRQALNTEAIPSAEPERIVTGLGSEGMHNARSLALDGKGSIYVNVGAPSNSCQVLDRLPKSPGQDPCPQLETHAGIWRFAADRPDQDKMKQGERIATGMRNAVALDWNFATDRLYLVQHGRDQLHESFADRFDARQGAELPAEEFFDVMPGDHLGWPYCYYDPLKQLKVLAPEYGGDGSQVGRCSQFKQPLAAFPAHYAPNDLLFYTGTAFPASYRQGAFVAFHGSWNRGREQQGFQVGFLPMSDGKPGDWKVFADGFAGRSLVSSPARARFRPVGLAQHPDGSLLILDSVVGRIWKVRYQG